MYNIISSIFHEYQLCNYKNNCKTKLRFETELI